MHVAFFSCLPNEQSFLETANRSHRHRITFLSQTLTAETASLAAGHEAVCVFINDQLTAPVLRKLAKVGVRLVALRCMGYIDVDHQIARQLGIRIVRVATYSPHSVAEHTVALLMSLNRKINWAYQRTKENNFTLDGLMGFELYGKKIGIIGTGRIGSVFARIMLGFGCQVFAYDKVRSQALQQLGVEYLLLNDLLAKADIVSLHSPVTSATHHLIDEAALNQMKRGAYLINTSQGELMDSAAVLNALLSGQLGALGIDVYEEESEFFFSDWSDRRMPDTILDSLTHLPNVLVTSHQGFFTHEAMEQIAHTALNNLTYLEQQQLPEDCVVVG